MARRPLGTCTRPGCGALSEGGPCSACKKLPYRGKTAERGYGADWRKVAAYVLQRDGGICQIRTHCGGDVTNEVDHILPVSTHPQFRLDPRNLQAACKSCNSAKGARFQLRGEK